MKEMSLVEHLSELRSRLIRIVIILMAAFFICYGQGEKITMILLSPLQEALGESGKIVYLGVLDKVLAQFQLAFWSAMIFSSPLWFYQLWKFMRPALYDNEVKLVRPFIFVGFILFCSGVLFGYYIVFPYTLETIMNFGVDVEATLSLKDYVILSSKVLVFLGLLFQLPNILLILGFMGVVDSQKLSAARRFVIVGFAVLAALMTPPDVITMMALWVPLVVLYEIGVLAVRLIVTPFKKKEVLAS